MFFGKYCKRYAKPEDIGAPEEISSDDDDDDILHENP
ncbi:BnaC01g32370D [Brassica napus]|uniref:BnaC01g32370D protein n=1 Tax=Brassica napus TaxID=3708 RepID=A0A078GQU8_BRANA|nr:BnaC01g32370D [Brassica napus]